MSALAVRDGMPSLAVPEPATASLSLFGLAALLMRRRRSR
ncbi:MAG: PEP-CTERM sorting domain-containing protein [Akkermansia sp.]